LRFADSNAIERPERTNAGERFSQLLRPTGKRIIPRLRAIAEARLNQFMACG